MNCSFEGGNYFDAVFEDGAAVEVSIHAQRVDNFTEKINSTTETRLFPTYISRGAEDDRDNKLMDNREAGKLCRGECAWISICCDQDRCTQSET